MSDVTQTLSKFESGDRSAADKLLPLLYDELRKLDAGRLADAILLLERTHLASSRVRKIQWVSRQLR